MTIDVDVNELLCDTFVEVASSIVNCEVDRVVMNGGRSSTKSQVASESIIIGCMTYRESAVAAVKYANKLEERLVNTFKESIRYLKVEDFWKLRKSPFEYVLLDEKGKETDVSIKFTGCDNPDNLKSFKPRKGSFRYVWFEEATNFASIGELNNLIQTFARGKGKHCVVLTYNPPKQTSNWVNKEYNAPIGKILGYDSNSILTEFSFSLNGREHKVSQIVHHSTYLDVIESGHADWLGTTFIGEAEKSKEENNIYYRWAYLGEVVGTEANVFHNVKDWDGDISKIDVKHIDRGLDWGYGGPDPTAYVEWYYDRRNRCIYCLSEFGKPKMEIEDVAVNIKKFNKHKFPVKADSGMPAMNQLLINKGISVIGASKGAGSIQAGILWLTSLNGIYICKTRTPKVYKEFSEYEYVIDKNDEITSKLPDKNNHFIDSTRYALSDNIKYD